VPGQAGLSHNDSPYSAACWAEYRRLRRRYAILDTISVLLSFRVSLEPVERLVQGRGDEESEA
jgi:hypothetical protein